MIKSVTCIEIIINSLSFPNYSFLSVHQIRVSGDVSTNSYSHGNGPRVTMKTTSQDLSPSLLSPPPSLPHSLSLSIPYLESLYDIACNR
jgi:hypothetical protein